MRINIVLASLCVFVLVACASPVTAVPPTEEVSVPIENAMPLPGAVNVTEMVVEPQGKLPAPSFESQTYLDEANGFALDFPAGWVVKPTAQGGRGSQTLLLSSAEIETLAVLPEGATRIALTVNFWDPKNDLAAYVATRKIAWDSSGFTILSEESLTLDLGLEAILISFQTADGVISLNLVSAIGDHYLTISGEGNLLLVREIMNYLRPIGQ